MIGEGEMANLLAQAQAMQQQLAQAQEDLANTVVDGSAGGGLVTVKVTGAGELVTVNIKPEACDPEDAESLGDLVLAAIRDATTQANALAASKMGPMTQGLGSSLGL